MRTLNWMLHTSCRDPCNFVACNNVAKKVAPCIPSLSYIVLSLFNQATITIENYYYIPINIIKIKIEKHVAYKKN